MTGKSAFSVVAFGLMLPYLASMHTHAATPTSSFGVSATVPDICIVSASTVALGAGTGAYAHAAASVSVKCSNFTPYFVGLTARMSTGTTLQARRIADPGSALLTYALFPNSAGTIEASPSADADPVAAAGSGRAQGSADGGELSAKRSVAPSAYADTMIVTVIY